MTFIIKIIYYLLSLNSQRFGELFEEILCFAVLIHDEVDRRQVCHGIVETIRHVTFGCPSLANICIVFAKR